MKYVNKTWNYYFSSDAGGGMKSRFIRQNCKFYKIESFKVDYCKKDFRQKTKGMKWISWEIWHFAGREIGRTQFFQP